MVLLNLLRVKFKELLIVVRLGEYKVYNSKGRIVNDN